MLIFRIKISYHFSIKFNNITNRSALSISAEKAAIELLRISGLRFSAVNSISWDNNYAVNYNDIFNTSCYIKMVAFINKTEITGAQVLSSTYFQSESRFINFRLLRYPLTICSPEIQISPISSVVLLRSLD